MRILVCGGRNYWLQSVVDKVLEEYVEEVEIIIEGGATGADSCAADWASRNGVKSERYRAAWKAYGKAAGYFRNKKMLDEGRPDLVIAFPGDKGTANMIKLATEAGVEVRQIT